MNIFWTIIDWINAIGYSLLLIWLCFDFISALHWFND
jgi:hypothetical protein